MTRICAHRGASGHAPENTLAALHLALDLGATMAEVDVQLSADGRAVLIHDLTLDRTTDGSGPVADMTANQLERLDAGSWFGQRWEGEKLALLEDVVSELGPRLDWNLELKGPGGPDLEKEVVRVVARAGILPNCLLTSFDHERINRLAATHPQIRRGYIIDKGGWRPEYLQGPVQVLSLQQDLVTAELVASAHASGKEVHAWTVNDPGQMRDLVALKVDVVITNYPDRRPDPRPPG